MLDPHSRLLYLEELRPPEGYQLDRAIATTFSLDLLSLLMAPLSIVFSEQRDKDELLKDPIAFLEALQRSKDRLAVFCQAGRIAIPAVDTPLYSYLEPIVVEVQPPGKGIFHPKVWVLRFVAEDEPVCYRLICLSRNLTFDRSWDTILTLDGFLDDQRQRGFGLNRSLADFIQELPSLAMRAVPPLVKEHIRYITDEIRRVRFDSPPEFDDIVAFKPSGIASPRKQPPLRNYDRLLAVSPFLTEKWLKDTLVKQGNNNVLISRSESLDSISPKLLRRLETNTKIYVMDEAAEHVGDEETQTEDTVAPLMSDLSGLHAKLYITERWGKVNVHTGSANATTPGFNGTNVEFMVELTGKRRYVGIDQFLGPEDNQTTCLRSMLQPYLRDDTPLSIEAGVRQKIEETLEKVRRAISISGLHLAALPNKDETFNLKLKAAKQISIDDTVQGHCRPISLQPVHNQDVGPLLAGQAVTFKKVSLVGLTGFLAFELTARLENEKASISFVLNLPVKGMPPDRDKYILHSIISDRNRFIRYLLFLLAEGKEFALNELAGAAKATGYGSETSFSERMPLLEELVRAFSRQPEKIDRIAKLVDDLKQSKGGEALIPEGFEQIWDAFMVNRGQGEK